MDRRAAPSRVFRRKRSPEKTLCRPGFSAGPSDLPTGRDGRGRDTKLGDHIMSTNTNANRKPTHVVSYVVGDKENSRWTPIGAAWAHQDGNGFNLKLEYLPLGTEGRIVIRKAKPKDEAQQ